jgi:hypothetical protein
VFEMMNDDKFPFAKLIATYISFRLARLGWRLTSRDLEYNSLVQVVSLDVDLGRLCPGREISIQHQSGERPLDLCGYLKVCESNDGTLTHVLVMRAVHGAKNEDIVLDEIWVDGSTVVDYLGRFYTFLVTGKWD